MLKPQSRNPVLIFGILQQPELDNYFLFLNRTSKNVNWKPISLFSACELIIQPSNIVL